MCICLQFLTNVFFVPYMALRERLLTPEQPQQEQPRRLPSFSRLFGAVSLGVGLISAAWLVGGRADFGPLDQRWQFAAEQFQGNRAFWAFVLDLGLYSVWQPILMKGCGCSSRLRFVPFFGLAAWLMAEGGSVTKGLRGGFWDPLDS